MALLGGGFVGIAEEHPETLGEGGILDDADGAGEVGVLDVGDDDANGIGETPPEIPGNPVRLVAELVNRRKDARAAVCRHPRPALRTRETVAEETPARWATSLIRTCDIAPST